MGVVLFQFESHSFEGHEARPTLTVKAGNEC